MGIFDGVSKSDGVGYTTDLFGSVKAPARKDFTPKTPITNESVLQKRAEEIKKQTESQKAFAAKQALGMENTIFPGMKKPNNVRVQLEKKVFTPTQFGMEINKAKTVFMESLTNALFVGAINTINCESCPIDDDIKARDGYKQITYEMCLSMFEDIRKTKDFNKVVAENKVPLPVCELWNIATEVAKIEANMRFDMTAIFESTGFDTKVVEDYLNNELTNICVVNESLASYYQDMTGMIIMEAGDVMDEIKGKVNAEIDNYKKSAQKIAEIKKSVREKLDDADSVTGANGKSDDPDDASNKPEGDDNADAGGEGDGSGTPAEGDGNPDNSGEGDGNAPENDPEKSGENDPNSAPTDGNEGNPDKDPPEGDSPADNTDPEKKQEGETPTGEGDDILENQEKVREISPKVTQEIEDACTFANNLSHTFNTGDEKFEAMRKRFSQEFSQALDAGDLDKVDEIQANVNAAKARIDEINASTNNKYSDVAKRYAELGSQIKFEIGQKITKTTKIAEESRTTFENLVLGIAKRKIGTGQVTVEGLQSEFDYTQAKATLDEAIINQTALETFNTLKLINAEDAGDRKSMKEFMDSIKK